MSKAVMKNEARTKTKTISDHKLQCLFFLFIYLIFFVQTMFQPLCPGPYLGEASALAEGP